MSKCIKLWKALRRLWRFATCTHINMGRSLIFEDTTELTFCRRCGRLLWFVDEGTRRHNPHLLQDQLDREGPRHVRQK